MIESLSSESAYLLGMASGAFVWCVVSNSIGLLIDLHYKQLYHDEHERANQLEKSMCDEMQSWIQQLREIRAELED